MYLKLLCYIILLTKQNESKVSSYTGDHIARITKVSGHKNMQLGILQQKYCLETVRNRLPAEGPDFVLLESYPRPLLGLSGVPMMLGKLLLPCRPANLDHSRARASALAVGAGGGCLDIFLCHLSFLFSLGDDLI